MISSIRCRGVTLDSQGYEKISGDIEEKFNYSVDLYKMDLQIYKTKVLTSGIVKRIFTKRNLIDYRKFKLIFRENQGLDYRETYKLS